jgi:hypothetical protein
MKRDETAVEILHWLDVEIDRLHEEGKRKKSSVFREEEAKHIRGYVAGLIGDSDGRNER